MNSDKAARRVLSGLLKRALFDHNHEEEAAAIPAAKPGRCPFWLSFVPRFALKSDLPIGLDNDACTAHILYVPHMDGGISGWRGVSWEWIVTGE